jgi:hypothetical protein
VEESSSRPPRPSPVARYRPPERRGSSLAWTDTDRSADDAARKPIALAPLGVAVVVDAPQELNHSSFALSGLADLLDLGLVDSVKVRAWNGLHRGEIDVHGDVVRRSPGRRAAKTTFFTVETADRSIRVGLDFRDAATIFPIDGLERCDVLFKRSYEPQVVAVAAATGDARIEPAGLSFAVRSDRGLAPAARRAGFWWSQARDAVRVDREVARRVVRCARSGRDHERLARRQASTASLRTPRCTETTSSGSPTILFQTRSFDRTDDQDANEIHEQRAGLIRALRAEFGPAFVGGFLPDDLVRRRWPDCVTSLPADKASYYGAMRDAAVSVYTRGLAGSAAWKLPEYLAHGCTIVGEPVAATLPEPLVDGRHWRTFRSPDELVERCVELLGDPEQRDALALAARHYYEAWVDPPVAMHRLLARAVEVTR